MGEKWQNMSFLGRTRNSILVSKVGTGTHGQRQSDTGTDQSGIGTHSQKRVGTSTDQSGTGTNASNSPDFCIRALLSPKLVH